MANVDSDKMLLHTGASLPKLINLFQMVGLSHSQAKVYLEIIKLKETTASVLCTATGVKSSRIYGILNDLDHLGLIHTLNTSPKHYIAVPLTEGLYQVREHLEKEYELKKNAIKELKLQLTPLFDSKVVIPSIMAHIIKGRNNILKKINYELSNVENELLIRFPSPELYFEFENHLLELQKTGIRIDAGLCQLSMKKLREESTQIPELPLTICKKCCDCFYLIVDQNYLLSVSNWTSSNIYAIWTTDTSLLNITSFFSSANIVRET
jgi:sugar-specific transcriptional regulator TrmB